MILLHIIIHRTFQFTTFGYLLCCNYITFKIQNCSIVQIAYKHNVICVLQKSFEIKGN